MRVKDAERKAKALGSRADEGGIDAAGPCVRWCVDVEKADDFGDV